MAKVAHRILSSKSMQSPVLGEEEAEEVETGIEVQFPSVPKKAGCEQLAGAVMGRKPAATRLRPGFQTEGGRRAECLILIMPRSLNWKNKISTTPKDCKLQSKMGY
jgi:hypothetical protein